MKASEWREVPGYGQRGVDILADLEATEKARDDAMLVAHGIPIAGDHWSLFRKRPELASMSTIDMVNQIIQLTASVTVLQARAEKAEADFDSEREACAAAVRQWNKAEAERDTLQADSTKAIEVVASMIAERDALKAELADYKESWKQSYEAGYFDPLVNARIRARREKEAPHA
jgi:hypothetical protein